MNFLKTQTLIASVLNAQQNVSTFSVATSVSNVPAEQNAEDSAEDPDEMLKIYRLFGDGYECRSKNCVPRPNRNPHVENRKKLRTPWSIDVSIFKEYLREERKDLIDDCFEADWACIK